MSLARAGLKLLRCYCVLSVYTWCRVFIFVFTQLKIVCMQSRHRLSLSSPFTSASDCSTRLHRIALCSMISHPFSRILSAR